MYSFQSISIYYKVSCIIQWSRSHHFHPELVKKDRERDNNCIRTQYSDTYKFLTIKPKYFFYTKTHILYA